MMMRLWTHEVLRVYYDRLVEDTDRSWLINCIRDTMKNSFGKDFDELFKTLDANNDGKYMHEHNIILSLS